MRPLLILSLGILFSNVSYAAETSHLPIHCGTELLETLWQHAFELENGGETGTLNTKGFDKPLLDAIQNSLTNAEKDVKGYKSCTIFPEFSISPDYIWHYVPAIRIGKNFLVKKQLSLKNSDDDDWDTYLVFGYDDQNRLRYANKFVSAKWTSCTPAVSKKNLVLACDGGDGGDSWNYKIIFDTSKLEARNDK